MDRTQGVPTTAADPVLQSEHVQIFAAVAREFAERAPAVAEKLGKSGGQWVAIGFLTTGLIGLGTMFVAHLVGDGTLRAKVNRTECHVEWLVEREVAKDRGEPLPAFHPLACGR
jgi:hypothetical protein